jgi:hypothetical protein
MTIRTASTAVDQDETEPLEAAAPNQFGGIVDAHVRSCWRIRIRLHASPDDESGGAGQVGWISVQDREAAIRTCYRSGETPDRDSGFAAFRRCRATIGPEDLPGERAAASLRQSFCPDEKHSAVPSDREPRMFAASNRCHDRRVHAASIRSDVLVTISIVSVGRAVGRFAVCHGECMNSIQFFFGRSSRGPHLGAEGENGLGWAPSRSYGTAPALPSTRDFSDQLRDLNFAAS